MGTSFAVIKIIIFTLAIILPLSIVIIRRLKYGSVMVPHSGILFAAILLPISYGLSAFFASDTHSAILGFNFNTDSLIVILLGFLALVLTVLLGIHKSIAQKLYLYSMYLIAGILILFLAQILVTVLNIQSLIWINNVRIVDSWIDIAALGGSLVISFFANQKIYNKVQSHTIWLAIVTIFIMLFLGVFTNITVVFVLLASVALVAIMLHVKTQIQSLSKSALIVPGIVLAISLLFVVDNTLLNAKISTMAQVWTKVSFIDVRPNWKGTLDVAKGAVIESDITSQLFGPGVGSFAQQWRLYKPMEVNATQFWNTTFNAAIGFIPTSIVTGGAVVLFAWMIFLLAVIWAVLRSRGSALGLAALYLWIFAIFNPIGTFVLVLAFIITGLFVADMARMRLVRVINYKLKGEDTHMLIKYAVVPLLCFASIAVMVTVIHRSVVNVYLTKASTLMIEGNMNDAEILLNKAKMFTDVALVEQGYTRIAFAQFGKLLQEISKENSDIDPEKIQAVLANVLSHAKRAIERDPKNPINYITLGAISEQLIALQIEGAAESALAAYTQAMALDPKNPSIPFAMARVYGSLEDITNATKALETSLLLKGNYVPALYQYGLLKLSQKDTKTAIQAFGTLVQINPNHANALYYLSLAFLQEGRIQDALIAMRKVSALNPENEEVKQIITALMQKSVEKSETTSTSTKSNRIKINE